MTPASVRAFGSYVIRRDVIYHLSPFDLSRRGIDLSLDLSFALSLRRVDVCTTPLSPTTFPELKSRLNDTTWFFLAPSDPSGCRCDDTDCRTQRFCESTSELSIFFW